MIAKSRLVLCLAWGCLASGVHAADPPIFGETAAYALGSLAAKKIQPRLVFGSTGTQAQFYPDVVMLYRREVLACGGLLDQIAPRFTSSAQIISNADAVGDDVLMVDRLRKIDPEIDAIVEKFAVEKFVSVLDEFSRGRWSIQPECISPNYRATQK